MENDKNLNQDLESDSRDTSPEDRKLGRAPLSVSEGDVSESHTSNGIEVKPVEVSIENTQPRISQIQQQPIEVKPAEVPIENTQPKVSPIQQPPIAAQPVESPDVNIQSKVQPVEKTPVAAFLAGHVLTLPMYADLAMEDVDRICEIILRCGE